MYKLFYFYLYLYELGKVPDGVLVRVANIDGLAVVAVHEQDEPPDQVAHVLEGPGLVPRPVDGQRTVLNALHHDRDIFSFPFFGFF